MNKIHENIKRFRQEKGLTQEEVAKELYVSRQLISKWEQGKSLPDIVSVEKLATIFGVTIKQKIMYFTVKTKLYWFCMQLAKSWNNLLFQITLS